MLVGAMWEIDPVQSLPYFLRRRYSGAFDVENATALHQSGGAYTCKTNLRAAVIHVVSLESPSASPSSSFSESQES